jgi:hypothetical protein
VASGGGGGDLDDHFIKTHIHSFIHGKQTMGVNDEKESNLILTLTEVEYEEEVEEAGKAGLFSCMSGGGRFVCECVSE